MPDRERISPDMLFADWNKYWLSLVRYRLRITTQKRYDEAFVSVIDPAFEGRKLCEITEQEAQAFFNKLRAKGISVARCSSLLAIAKLSMDFALNRRLISYNPFSMVLLPRKFRKKTAILYDQDVRKLLELYEDHHMMPLIMVILLCGLRIGEALGMTWDRVDLKKRTMEICQQMITYRENGEQIQRIVPYTKNGDRRTIVMPELAVVWLKRQRALQMEMKERSNAWKNEPPLIFSDENGGFVRYHQVYYRFNKLMEEIGRPDVSLHSLRHTAATTVLYTTGDLAAQQRYLGHRSVNTAMRYGGATMEAQRRFAEAIDAAFAELCAEGLGIHLSDEVIRRIREIQAGALIVR